MYRQTTKQAARGKWDGILAQLIGEQAVTRRHGPCPICGGKDRYRYDNKRNDGDWFCNICGVGDGFRLLQESLGISFADAARQVDRVVGTVEEKPFKEDIDFGKRRKDMNEAWRAAINPEVAVNYLLERGIPEHIISIATDIRGIQSLFYTDTSRKYNASLRPAMLALIRNSKGKPIGLHRTYITQKECGMGDMKEKKIMPTLENITGGYIKLGEPEDTLCLAEGIETALAAWAHTGFPAWATISAHGLESFETIPMDVKRVIVCADNDLSFVGQAAAFKCAANLQNRKKIPTEVWMPPIDGTDMLDYYARNQDTHLRIWQGKTL